MSAVRVVRLALIVGAVSVGSSAAGAIAAAPAPAVSPVDAARGLLEVLASHMAYHPLPQPASSTDAPGA